MPKLKEVVLNTTTDESGKISYPKRAAQISSEVFPLMYTGKKQSDAMNNGVLVDEICTLYSDHLKGKFEPKAEELYLDLGKLQAIDTKKRLISSMGINEIMELDIEQVIVGRAIAKIIVPGLHDKFFPSVVINMNEHGDEFAFGFNVELCSNFTIMGSGDRYSTYKKQVLPDGRVAKLSQTDVLGLLERKMQDSEFHAEQFVAQVEKWSAVSVSKSDFQRFVGEQFIKISDVNWHMLNRNKKALKDSVLAVNGVQLGRIAVEANKPSHKEYNWENDASNVWNIINYGTEVLKFQNGSDSPTVLQANERWVGLVDQTFSQN